ncbi:hypothetical protein [Rhodopirellula sp. SWK7]|uniref:hypothetical protein n=1 Tax=Rhodopirellula sp. SWK7 TaxID=595460 RepID=UPI00118190CE|nr:hypothetical protein [Rhodopirellula sp. SWK7]
MTSGFPQDPMMQREGETPIYFPRIEKLEMPAITETQIETVALILSAINPSVLKEATPKPQTLYQVNQNPKVVRVDPSVELRQDHRYLLSPLHDGTDASFDKLWAKAKRVKGASGSSALLDLVQRLRDWEIDEEGLSLTRSKQKTLAAEMFPYASRLQYYFFHSAVQRIDRELRIRRVASEVSSPLLGGLLKRFFETPEMQHDIDFPEPVLEEAEMYIASSINLCRVLRSIAHRIRRAKAS